LLGEVDASPALTRLLMQCDGDTTSTLLVSGAPDAEEETWRGLHALLLLGLVEPSRKHRADHEAAQGRAEIEAELQRVENADYYTVLGVPSLATSDQIREAYYVLARRYHPDRFRTGPLEHLREQVEGYFAKVTEAYNTLYDPPLRAMYDEARLADRPKEPAQDRAHLAQENFRRAQDLIAKGRFTDAVTSLENAIQLDGQNASYRLTLGRLLAANPRFRKQAEEHLIEANRIDPSLVDGYGALAELYAKSGRRKDAIRVFREVLRWDPDHEEAKRHLRELGSG
jgi:curved DNA-binding protein CbpA